MQYTGLKDKNGKEIYEGDICYVYPDEWEFQLEGCNHNVIYFEGGFGLKRDKNPFYPLYKSLADYCNVIGNIYENPELLEVKK
jgi:uncharacterized phage protein (TIGR01671 family)